MASPYMFGVFNTYLNPAQVQALRTLAERHGAEFVHVGRTTGSSSTGWFELSPQLGSPHDDNRARPILATIKLWRERHAEHVEELAERLRQAKGEKAKAKARRALERAKKEGF